MSSWPHSPSQSVCFGDLAVHASVEEYENFRIVTDTAIPDLFTLSEAGRHALCDKLEAGQDPSSILNINAIESKLLDLSRQSPITPPPNHIANITRARELEERSRKALLDAGCPPCYSPDLELPLRNIPEKYEVISYWQSLPGTGLVVLTTQLSNWVAFCEYQQSNRRHYVPRGMFPTFLDKVRDRRRRHGLEGDICLLPEPSQQTRLENWIEFQDYHLELHELEEKGLKEEWENLDTARKRWETSREAIDVLQGRVKHAESKLEEHRKMLRWIEQQRKEIVDKQATSVQIGDHDQPASMPTSSSPGRRKRNQSSRSSFDPVRSAVSKKSFSRQKSLRLSRHDLPRSAKTVSVATQAPRRSKRIADREDKLSWCGIKSTPLRHPQRPTGAKMHARKSRQSVSTNVNPIRQPTRRAERRKALEQPSSEVTKRRNGRERGIP